MGGDRPGGRAEGGRGRLSAVTSYLRFLGLDSEPFDLAVPTSAGEVIQRLYTAAPPVGPIPVPGPPVTASVAVPLRDTWRDGVRLSMPDGGRGRAPEAFVRVLPDGSSARVVGEIRPSRWVQAFMALYAVFVAGWVATSSRPLIMVPLVLVVGAVGHALMKRELRADRAALRAWLTKTVTGTRRGAESG